MPQLVHLLGRTLLARNSSRLAPVRAFSCAHTSALSSRRSYATTTRATKPTVTVKKAVKTAAAKKPVTKAKAKATPAKKAAPAKTAAKKKPAAKNAAKKKPAAKKAAPRKRAKKVLTPEEKEKAKIRELRVKALKEPVTQRSVSPFHVYIAEKVTGSKGSSADTRAHVADAARAFKNLTPAELEHYNHLANQKTVAKQAEFKAWLHSHTPEEIRVANNARTQLRKKLAGTQKKGVAYTTKLHDDRLPKNPLTPYIYFFVERHATGDFKSIKAPDAAKLIGTEWKALSAAEKKKYEDAAKNASPAPRAAA